MTRRAAVGWWPAEFATDDERLAYRIQDAFLKKQVAKQGPLVGYKIALTSPQILAQVIRDESSRGEEEFGSRSGTSGNR